jgi:methyl-accepting chemotaxis protein
MRTLTIFVIVSLALLSVAKEKVPETIDQLKARAAATTDKRKQIDLYLELSKRELESANDVYNTNVEQARTLFEDSSQSAEKAAHAALESNHKLKQTEIKLRELSHRMSDIRRTWAFEDRAPLDPAIQRVETARTKLLDRMFQK